MRRAALATAALLLLASACTASRVNREQDVTVTGTVLRAGNAPVAGAGVSLVREGDAGDVFLTIASVGLACLGDKPRPATCDDAKRTITRSNGEFRYELKGRDTQATFGTSAVLAVSTSLAPRSNEAAGSSTTYRFHAQTRTLRLPVRLWEPSLTARTGSFGARVTFPRVPRDLFPPQLQRGSLSYSVEFARGDETLWRIDRATPVTRFDPRVLEDSTGSMRVVAGMQRVNVSDQLGDEVAIAMRSGARAYESPLEPPPSRGKPCSVSIGDGEPVPQSPCGLTDGGYLEEFRPTVCATPRCNDLAPRAATVDLGRGERVDLIVVRGCADRCRVETSTNAAIWRLAGIASADPVAVTIATPRSARYIRVTSSSLHRLTEVSIWTGRPAVPDAALLVAPAPFPVGGGARRGAAPPGITKDDDLGPWPVVAAGLLGLAVGGLLVAFARWRRRVL